MQEYNKRFIRWSDRWLHLTGRLLLAEGLRQFGYQLDCLKLVEYDSYKRPFIHGDIDFNISHSGEYVVCAIGKQVRIGIDIEKIQLLRFEEVSDVMTGGEWKMINNSPFPAGMFYSLWVMKESTMKADGRGLSIPLDRVIVSNDFAGCDGNIWYLQQLNVHNEYRACLATDSICDKVSVQYLCLWGKDITDKPSGCVKDTYDLFD